MPFLGMNFETARLGGREMTVIMMRVLMTGFLLMMVFVARVYVKNLMKEFKKYEIEDKISAGFLIILMVVTFVTGIVTAVGARDMTALTILNILN